MNIKILAISIISNLIIGAGLFFFHILAPKLALMIMVAVVAGLASIFISMFIEHSMQKALWYHCRKGNTAQALQYMTAGANINKPNSFGSTALHVATYSNNAEIIQKLIAAGANPDSMDTSRRTPLHLAVLYDKENAAMALIPKTQNIDRPSTNGNTALLLATEQGRYNLVEALIQAGANVNIRSRQGFTPLHNAAYMGRIGAINLLIQADANFHAADQFGNTPLHWATKNGQIQAALVLIKTGAKVNASNNKGNTPLHWATYYDHTETAAALINKGANPNASNNQENTPLHYAARLGRIQTVIELIKGGAKVNATDIGGKTPLHWAIESGAYATALAIIHYGQVPDQQIPYIENNQTSRRIHKLYEAPLPKNFGTMMPIKIYFTSTKGRIKNLYKVIVTMMHNRHKNNRTSLSSLPLDALNQILQYAGLSLSSQVICHESLLPTSEELKLNKKENLSQEKVDSGLSQNDNYPLTTSTPAA